MSEPAYRRLQVDERRQLLLDAGAALFAEHAFEEISMRQIAEAAGVSKPLLYHYYPSKIDLFKAAVAEHAIELQRLIDEAAGATPFEQLSNTLDAYLEWIDGHARTWSKLLQSAATLPEARELVTGFRRQTLTQIVEGLTGSATAPPALRTALTGWLAAIDAAILDWLEHRDLTRHELRSLLLAAFGAAVMGAQGVDPSITLAIQT